MTDQKHPALITRLYHLADTEDRGALAALRRGAGKRPGTETATFPHVVPFIPEGDQGLHRAWPYFCVASLFALHPERTNWEEGFGTSYHKLKESDSRDARFRAMLNAHESDLPNLLRQAVRQLASNGTPIDWASLLRDLRGWGHPDQYVQRRWAQQFWAPRQDGSEPGRTGEADAR
jgi:CRISPR system Cascade subunit CasB